MAVGEEVKDISLYKLLPTWRHGYILPFVCFYVSLFCGWVYFFGSPIEQNEGLLISVAVIAALNLITALFCVWSVDVRCLLTCKKVIMERRESVCVCMTNDLCFIIDHMCSIFNPLMWREF